MKLSSRCPFFLMLLLLTTGARAQTITYSEPEKKDFWAMGLSVCF
jgi:hypothetical protein